MRKTWLPLIFIIHSVGVQSAQPAHAAQVSDRTPASIEFYPYPDLFKKCSGSLLVYRFNDCAQSPKRLQSGFYGLCRSNGQEREIFRFFSCPGDTTWRALKFTSRAITRPAEGDLMVYELRLALRQLPKDAPVERRQVLEKFISDIHEIYPSHGGD